jgi:magnesium transporter
MTKPSVRTQKAGLPPGSLIPAEDQHKVRLWHFAFNELSCNETQPDVLDFTALKNSNKLSWINIDGLSDTHLLEKIGIELGIHNLTLEDIVTIDQRPKFEDHEKYLYIVLKMIDWSTTHNDLNAEQVSILLLPNVVLSFQERPGDVFNLIRERLRRGVGRTRKEEADYLVYSIMDAIVDNYFTVMERLRSEIEMIEDEVIEDPTTETSYKIHKMRSKVSMLRRSIWPLREVISTILRTESDLIKPEILPYIRDLYDHTIKVIETLETFRDTLAGLLDIYLSSVSNKMNEVMKVLTMISTVFIPLSFLAGLYGMNFQYMPELHFRWSYPILLGIMALFVVFFLLFFKRKKWI